MQRSVRSAHAHAHHRAPVAHCRPTRGAAQVRSVEQLPDAGRALLDGCERTSAAAPRAFAGTDASPRGFDDAFDPAPVCAEYADDLVWVRPNAATLCQGRALRHRPAAQRGLLCTGAALHCDTARVHLHACVPAAPPTCRMPAGERTHRSQVKMKAFPWWPAQLVAPERADETVPPRVRTLPLACARPAARCSAARPAGPSLSAPRRRRVCAGRRAEPLRCAGLTGAWQP